MYIVGIYFVRDRLDSHQRSLLKNFFTLLFNKHTHTTHNTGIDRLERLKGIPLKLMAIDQFITENPQWLGKIVFGLIGISAVERGQVCACVL